MPRLQATERRTPVLSLRAATSLALKIKRTLLNVHLCCDHGWQVYQQNKALGYVENTGQRSPWCQNQLHQLKHDSQSSSFSGRIQWTPIRRYGPPPRSTRLAYASKDSCVNSSVMMRTWHMLTAGATSPHSTQLLRTPLVCQQVVQPMERIPDYPRMQCVDSGTQHSLVDGNKLKTKVWKGLWHIIINMGF